MRDALWIPDGERIATSRMKQYMDYVNGRYHRSFTTYKELYHWSVTEVETFWGSLWEYFDIVSSAPYTAGHPFGNCPAQ